MLFESDNFCDKQIVIECVIRDCYTDLIETKRH